MIALLIATRMESMSVLLTLTVPMLVAVWAMWRPGRPGWFRRRADRRIVRSRLASVEQAQRNFERVIRFTRYRVAA